MTAEPGNVLEFRRNQRRPPHTWHQPSRHLVAQWDAAKGKGDPGQ